MSASPSLENAETVAAPLAELSLSEDAEFSVGSMRSSGAFSAAARGFVNLVEGSTPHLTGETRLVLRNRLQAVAWLFFAGFLAFWVSGLIFKTPTPAFRFSHVASFVAAEQTAIWWFHLTMSGLTGLIAVWLSRAPRVSLTTLRLTEYTLFGSVVLFFSVTTHYRLEVNANLAEGEHLPVIVPPWMMLMFTYALFIPNTWRRSLRFLLPATVFPIGLILLQQRLCEGFRECVSNQVNASYISEQSLELLLSFATAVVGVHTINTLRRQAFEAKQLGQYRLKEKIGTGGMGEVYLAEHQMMKRPCAVKVIRPEKAGDPKTLARFEREVRSTAKLSHWNSVDIYDYGRTDDGTFYYVMEYLPGHNVGEIVEKSGPMEPERVVYLMNQVCRGLSEAHENGLVHRDIKPANIFCSYRGGEYDVAKLLDFGLAKPTVDNPGATQNVNLTAEGAITGSPLFMSPEQASGEREADVRSDIYSLGCVLYYLTTGKPPFAYSQAVKVIIAHASEEVVPPREHNPEIPAELEDLILHCLEKDPEDRFASAEDLRLALADLPLDNEWTSEQAYEWWNCNGCPQRKALAAKALEAAAV